MGNKAIQNAYRFNPFAKAYNLEMRNKMKASSFSINISNWKNMNTYINTNIHIYIYIKIYMYVVAFFVSNKYAMKANFNRISDT